jgi:hypothetical protein
MKDKQIVNKILKIIEIHKDTYQSALLEDQIFNPFNLLLKEINEKFYPNTKVCSKCKIEKENGCVDHAM